MFCLQTLDVTKETKERSPALSAQPDIPSSLGSIASQESLRPAAAAPQEAALLSPTRRLDSSALSSSSSSSSSSLGSSLRRSADREGAAAAAPALAAAAALTRDEGDEGLHASKSSASPSGLSWPKQQYGPWWDEHLQASLFVRAWPCRQQQILCMDSQWTN
jgi:hypothetical protein